MGSIPQKHCPRCNTTKPFDEFRGDRNRRDGHYPYCKACERAYQQAKACSTVVTERYCPACRCTKPTTAFSKNKNTQDGLMRYCKECDGIKASAFRATHQDYLKQTQAKYRAEHNDEIRAGQKRCYEAKRAQYIARNVARQQRNPEAARQRRNAWKRRNPNKVRELRMRYNARKVAATAETVDYEMIWSRDQGICHICHLPVERSELHYDHIIPLSKGGEHTTDNIAVSHSWCNLRKGAKITAWF